MAGIEIKVDTREVIQTMRKRFGSLTNYQFEVGVNRAINRSLAVARTDASKGIRKVYDLQAGPVRKALSLQKSNRKTFEGKLIATGRPIPLKNFKPRQTRKGVTVSIKKGEGRKLIKGAFTPKLPSGFKGVFGRGEFNRKSFSFRHKRVTPAGGYTQDPDTLKYQPNNPDSPIKQLTSLSIPKAFTNSQVESSLKSSIEDYFPKRLVHELNFILTKGAK